MLTIPSCFILKVQIINSHPVFSCYSLPSFLFSLPYHYFILALSILFIFSVIILLILSLRLFIRLKRQLSQTNIILEIIPPSNTKQTTLTTEQFMTNLHGIEQNRSFVDTLLGRKNTFSLELIATKEKGIRYMVTIPETFLPALKRQLLSFLPGATITEVEDYFKKEKQQAAYAIKELKLAKSYMYSLQEQSSLSQYDPIAYVTGHMTKLQKGEIIAVQFILTPVTSDSHPNVTTFIRERLHRIENGEDATTIDPPLLANIVYHIALSIPFILFSPFTILLHFIMPSKDGNFLPFFLFGKAKQNIPQKLSSEKQRLNDGISQKLQKELFEATIRIYVSQENKQIVKARMEGLLASFKPFHTGKQKLQVKYSSFFLKQFFLFFLNHRFLALRDNPILSVSELANLYHFPYTPITHTEDLVQSKNQELPAPLSLKNSTDLTIIFAKNIYGGMTTSIGQSRIQRRRHTYIIGGTGMGKTTLLYSMIMQDILAGNGVNVTDPHGDLIQKILQTIPKERMDEVVLFDPDDTDHPMGFNILELPQGLSKDEEEKYKDKLAGALIATFQKLFPPKTAAYRMEHILRLSILTVLETERPTLFTIQKLLTDYKYRKQVVDKLTDPILINFWKKEFASMGSMQRADAISPITTRLGEFFSSHMARNILLQEKTTIDFKDIMDNNKILLCDLSKGKITKSMSAFFGALITSQIELTALQRARIPEKDRTDFYVYIDEFQNFATPSFVEMMGESRKYRVNMILAHQSVAQIEDKDFIDIVLTNTGTVISFRTGSPTDEQYLLPFFTPEVNIGQLNSLPPYHFYIKITDTNPSVSFTGETEISNINEINESAEIIRELSRRKYTRKKNEVEREIAHMLAEETKQENNDTDKTKNELTKAETHYLKKEDKYGEK